VPTSYYQNGIAEPASIEFLEAREKVILDPGKKWIRCPVEYLYRRRSGSERPVRNQCIDRLLVWHYQMRLLHVEVVEKVPHAVSAIQRAPDHMIETQARLSVVYDLFELLRQIRASDPYSTHLDDSPY
jgi:hypothetical protein